MRVLWIIFFGLVACSSPSEKSENEIEDEGIVEEAFVSPEAPDHDFYIDDELVEGVELEFGIADSGKAKPVLAEINGGKYEVVKYEGTLIKASGNSEGYNLRFQPYHEIDPDTEQEIKSAYDYYLDVQISRTQNDYLGFVIHSDETNNLEWDYLENLFEVYYYVNDGKNYPLKVIDHGKTEWDG